jgi:hypothetical protein
LSVLRITASHYPFGLFSLEAVILSTDNTTEKREKAKGVMRSRNSKYRQYNGKERKDKEITSLSFLSFPLYCLYLELRLLITSLAFSLFSIVLSVLRITASDYLFILDNTMEKREKMKR